MERHLRRPKFAQFLWPTRLPSQVALLTILLFSLGILFFAVHVARENVEYVTRQIEQSGVVLARNVATTGSAYLFSTYYKPLEELLLQAADFPNVDELEITDTDGVIVREAKRLETGQVNISSNKHRYTVPEETASTTIERQQEKIVVWQPIVSGVLQGWVRVEMNLAQVRDNQLTIYRNLLGLGGAILLVILAAMLMFMRRPMQSLAALTEFAGTLVEKHGETIDSQDGSEELVRMRMALNKVSNELRDQDIDIQQAMQSLETQKAALDEHSIVSITDVQGYITYANDKFCEVSGYHRQELLGTNHRIVKSNKHNARFYETLWQTISGGQVWKGVICNRSRSGREYWVETTIVPFLDSEGCPYQYVAIRTEVTQLKNLARELQANRDRLEMSQNFASVGSWEWDMASDEIYWSEQVPQIFALPVQVRHVHMAEFSEMVHEADRQIIEDAIHNCLQNNLDYNVEHRIVRPDGSVRWVQERGNVERDERGEPIRMLGVVQDVTERKESERNLRSLERQIHQSQKMEAIGSMAGGIAHDFNNILTSIIGYAELNLMDMQQDSDLWQNQNEILTAAYRARDLVNQILTFSRKSPDDEAVVKPGRLVNEAIRLLKVFVLEPVQLQLGSIDENVTLKISPTQFHQIILNLCINASHALESKRKGTITVSLQRQTHSRELTVFDDVLPAGEYVCLEISDDGCGIQDEVLPHIFEPFFSTKAVGRGTGMGLSVVYGIVKKAGGGIEVESVADQGACFKIYFPLYNSVGMKTGTEA